MKTDDDVTVSRGQRRRWNQQRRRRNGRRMSKRILKSGLVVKGPRSQLDEEMSMDTHRGHPAFRGRGVWNNSLPFLGMDLCENTTLIYRKKQLDCERIWSSSTLYMKIYGKISYFPTNPIYFFANDSSKHLINNLTTPMFSNLICTMPTSAFRKSLFYLFNRKFKAKTFKSPPRRSIDLTLTISGLQYLSYQSL